MKSLFLLAIATTMTLCSFGQEKKKAPSPPAEVKETIAGGAVVTIAYSQPSLKGRTIGKDVEPMDGKVWRAGANKTTLLELSKNVKVDGKEVAAGKYGLFVVSNGGEWTFIISKVWDKWGTEYSEADDLLRIAGKITKLSTPAELLTYKIAKNGTVTLSWGDTESSFKIN